MTINFLDVLNFDSDKPGGSVEVESDIKQYYNEADSLAYGLVMILLEGMIKKVFAFC